jgi:hypothetical protein
MNYILIFNYLSIYFFFVSLCAYSVVLCGKAKHTSKQ